MTNKQKIDDLSTQLTATRLAADEISNTCEAEGRDMTEEEMAKQGTLTKECSRLLDNIETYQKIEDVDARRVASKRVVSPNEGRIVQPGTPARIELPKAQHRLRAFRGADADKHAYYAGKWCKAHIYEDPDARTWCREHGVESRVMQEGVLEKGGATVPDVLESAIIDLRDEYSLARREANMVTMSSDVQIIPRRTGGVTAYFPNELVATTESDMAWDNVTLTAKEVSALTRISKSLTEDSIINMADKIAFEMGYAFAVKEDECLVNGDGTDTFGGMVGFRTALIDGTHGGAIIEATANDDEFDELLLPDIISIIGPLAQFASRTPKWYMSQNAWGVAILRLVSALGGNAIQNVQIGMDKVFMGYPVEISASMPGYTATNWNDEVMIAFGDLSMAATMGTRRGVTIEVDRSRYLEYRQFGVLGTERFDIVVHDLGTAVQNTSPLTGIIGTS